MPPTTRAVLSCMWPPPMGSQESFRYVQLADPGCLGRAGYPDPGFQDRVWADPPTALFPSSLRLCSNQAFRWIWKPETSKVSWLWPGLVWQAGWEDRVVTQVQVPHCVHYTGLTPLHTAILALNAAMLPPTVCPRMLSSQARDRLACVQMLLQMGASHTSQVSLAGKWGEWHAHREECVKGRVLNADLVTSHCETLSIFLHFSESRSSMWLPPTLA